MDKEVLVTGTYGEAKIFTHELAEHEVLESTKESIKQMLSYEGTKDTTVRIMPDYHVGKGCVIGTTMKLNKRVVPSYVGVDIGCGILAVKLKKEPTKEQLEKLDEEMDTIVPSGIERHENKVVWNQFKKENLIANIKFSDESTGNSLGTLGGGNHFIEMGKSQNGEVYLFIHSGSRGFGSSVARAYINKAVQYQKKLADEKLGLSDKQIIDKYMKINPKLIEQKLKELKERKKELQYNVVEEHAYLEGKLMEEYLHDLKIAQQYAKENRLEMVKAITDFLGTEYELVCDSIHNYIELDKEQPILRKGSCRAEKGETVVIPLNMKDGVILAKGKGNEEWNNSAPHGAGRIYSRTRAKNELSLDKFKDEMEGILTTSVVADTLDESPMAYKPKEEILSVIEDTVGVIEVIKPIYNFKAK